MGQIPRSIEHISSYIKEATCTVWSRGEARHQHTSSLARFWSRL